MKTPLRVVLDTNVVLSALIFEKGRLADMRRAWQEGKCSPLVSTATVSELLRALGYPKFRLSAEAREELIADYLPWCTTIRMPGHPPKTPPCRDPDDVAFLQLAIVGEAGWLVTGDKDLLSLNAGKSAFPASIVTAEQFLKLLPGN